MPYITRVGEGEPALNITYCQSCGVRMKADAVASQPLCERCKAGYAPRRRTNRDSSQIPRKKLDQHAHTKHGHSRKPGH